MFVREARGGREVREGQSKKHEHSSLLNLPYMSIPGPYEGPGCMAPVRAVIPALDESLTSCTGVLLLEKTG
jgi:hypothetical protein